VGPARGPLGDDEDVMWRERGLRGAAQPEDGEPAVARDEAGGKRAAGGVPLGGGGG